MKKLKTYRLRFLIMLALLAVVAVGYFTAGGIGNFCGIGFESITLLCPLGALLAMIAERTAIPMAVISVAVVLLVCIVLGKVFCAWACPVHFLSRGRKKGDKGDKEGKGGKVASPCSACASPCGKAKGIKIDSRHGILAAALGSTLVFGFPVFCLVCPIGLTFATVLLVMRLVVAHVDALVAAHALRGKAPVAVDLRLADDRLRRVGARKRMRRARRDALRPARLVLAEIAPAAFEVHARCARVQDAVLKMSRSDGMLRAHLAALLAMQAAARQLLLVLPARRAQQRGTGQVLHAAQPDDGARSHGSQGERAARHAGARIALGLDAVLVHHATSTSVSADAARDPSASACGLRSGWQSASFSDSTASKNSRSLRRKPSVSLPRPL